MLSALAVVAGCGGGGSSIAPPASTFDQASYTVSAYGDSTQEAQGQPHAASRPGFTINNMGVSGATTTSVLAGIPNRLFPWPQQMARETAKMVIINLGINDREITVDQYRANLNELVDIAQKADKVVMLEEPNPAGETMTPLMIAINFDISAFEARRVAMKDVATQKGVYFCAQPRVSLEDGIHPDQAGRAGKANVLAKCVSDLM